MPTQKKIDTVTKLSDKLNRAKSVILTDNQNLTHKQVEEIKKALKKVNGELTVTKNTLFKRALKNAQKVINEKYLNGTTAALFAFADEVIPLKELVKFYKNFNIGKIKAGLLGKDELDDSEVMRLSKLPTRQMLYAQLAGQIKAPLYGLHNALSWNMRKLVWSLEAVKVKKTI